MNDKLKSELKKHGQDHLLNFYDGLNKEEKEHLIDDINCIDLAKIVASYEKAILTTVSYSCKDLTPPPKKIIGGFNISTEKECNEYRDMGLMAISEGQIAVLLLAGGQGTRLGVTYPKGMYDVGLPSKKTLYHIQAERIKKIQEIATLKSKKECIVPWYIMTSEFTQELTEEFFVKNKYFGLNGNDIKFFEQNMIPCFDNNGKIILESKSKISRAPDGNGGLYEVLKTAGILDDMDARGVRYVHIYCVDNILVHVADPLFMGYCIAKHADCAAKVVEKVIANEAVGVVCGIGENTYGVLEYSEIDSEVAGFQDADGRLMYRHGGIANHFATTAFLRFVANDKCNELPYHIARKKIIFCGKDGEPVKPTSPNGVKLEKFFFDVFPFSKSFYLWLVDRESEFSPLKNSDGALSDCPSTCRSSIFHLHSNWLKKAGATITSSDNNSKNPVICEIAPSISYAGEDLEDLVHNKTFEPPIVIQ